MCQIFLGLFSSEGSEGEDQHLTYQILKYVPSMVTPIMNMVLTHRVSDEVVKVTVFQMGGEESFGNRWLPWCVLSKILGCFRRRYQQSAVHTFFETNTHLSSFFYTYIALIHKIPSPVTTSHFSPISMCNFNYKIISKVFVNRLKFILSRLITLNQSEALGFLKDHIIRLEMANILTYLTSLTSTDARRFRDEYF